MTIPTSPSHPWAAALTRRPGHAGPPPRAQVDIYGFHISERHGVPYHYHNRCPQPFMHRDVAEWLMVRSFKEHSLIEFRDACVFECHGSDEECTACKVPALP